MRQDGGLISTAQWAKPFVMMYQMRITLMAIAALLTLALVATGFGHRMPTAQDAQLEVIAQMGGLSDICADLNGDGIPDDDCPVCHLNGSADLPSAPPSVQKADLAFVTQVIAPRESRAIRTVLDPARGLRAPPLA